MRKAFVTVLGAAAIGFLAVATDQTKKTDPRYQQMWDPCQVEG
jgi:hypothetical protein